METMATEWVRTYQDGPEYLEHLGGVDWFDAPHPRRWHKCKPQTRGWMMDGYVERCTCGATRLFGDGPWMERNQRR